MKKVLMIAAENGALPQGKVGGMGDVTRDLPRAIVAAGHRVTVMTPAYGVYASLTGARLYRTLTVPFGGGTEQVDWYVLPADDAGVVHEVLDHPRFAPWGPGRIYCDDGPGAPFHTDATKFAFFSAAAAAAACEARPDVVHLHDWHVGPYLALRAFDRRYEPLQRIRTVFTIHNLALQGTRPLADNDSSWHTWFPWLRAPRRKLVDPVYADCVNPMAIGIRLADMVNTVSPTYAREILEPNDAAKGFHGGEGLERDLVEAAAQGRLTGILNGCEYPSVARRRPPWRRFLELAAGNVLGWIAAERAVSSAHYVAEKRIGTLPRRRPACLLTSIGRITAQKVALLREPVSSGPSALEHILEALGDEGFFVMLGSGDPDLERFFAGVAVRRANFLFLNGYSDRLAGMLYASGDLFLMPSSFEPCGISQMLAMRAGQPCVAHSVGGLKDTVTERNGFPFGGDGIAKQAANLVRTVRAALELRRSGPAQWRALCGRAAAERFDWQASAAQYLTRVYAFSAE